MMPQLLLSADDNEGHPSDAYYDKREQMSFNDCKKEVKSFNKGRSGDAFIKVGVVLDKNACDVIYLGDLAESNEKALLYIKEIYQENESPLLPDSKLDHIYHVQWAES